MNQHSSTRVENPQGFVHAGAGDIYVTVGSHLQDSDKPAFRRIAEDQLHRLKRVLVDPVNMGRARATLADTGTVILDGDPGSGRTAAARVLLHECHRGGVFRELSPDEEEELSLHDPALVETGDRLLLDLAAAGDRQWSAVLADLPALRKAVHERHAHLVVVMPRGGALDPDLQYYRVEIRRPRGREVLARHLRVHGVPCEQDFRSDATVNEFLRGEERPMRDIADFADLVRRARESARPDEGFAQWCATAGRARDGRRKEVAALVARLREAPQRALLIAVAMLHGAHADVVHRAAQLLLHTLDCPPEQGPLLQHKDLAERLEEVSADTGPGGCVRFAELDYDSAVRAHFWDHVPDLRPHLGTWVARVVDLNEPHVTSAVRDDLVGRVARQHLRTGRWDGLASLAEGWGSETVSKARLEAAVQALTCGLNDPIYGRHFRERIYQWCAQRRLRGEFAQVLVRVCADVLAVGHPDQALLRLYYLAQRERDTTRALQALCDLVASSRRLRRRLLDRLTRSDFTPSDLGIYLRICDPVPLTDPSDASRALVEENAVQRSLTICWHAALARLPRTTWQPQAECWLHRAADDTGHRGELLLDLLVGAAERCGERRGEVFAALYASARDAERTAPTGPARSVHITELLLHKIGVAQGLGPTTPPTPAGGTRP